MMAAAAQTFDGSPRALECLGSQLQYLHGEFEMGRSTGRNLRNRRRKQQIKKKLRQQSKQAKKTQSAAGSQRVA
jgi:hypothetical protein